MASYFYTSFVPTLLCALFVIQTLEFSHSKALTNVSCIGAEREALLKFKQDVIDPSRRLGSWIGESCCEWEGVECSEKTGHVSKLDLRNPFDDGPESCSLEGKIHPALNELKYLKYLDLSYNNFTTHKTQKSLTSLHKMEYLNLSYAGHGHISNQLSNLSSLMYLDLSGWLWWGPSLRTENLLWLSTFSNLKYLDLSYNSMNSSIPPWFQNFSRLEHLDLSDNDLQGIFPTVIFENSQWLGLLDVSLNRMECELLKNSSIFCNLQVLKLSSNKFSGRIFETIDGALNCGQSNLKIVDINGNSFTGHLPHQFGNFKDLEFLDLSRNSISGPISATIGQLSSLRMLNLSFNKLSGNILESIGRISNLEVMDIGNNQLDGIVSQIHFANLTNLTVLKIHLNGLVINFSASWVPPFQIEEILMSSCKVGPRFPNWLQTQKKVLALDMSNASISDEVPLWLSDVLSSIEHLDLSSNMLRGDISRIIGKKMPLLTQLDLVILDLSDNQFSGRIPLSGKPASFEIIDLGGNYFTGDIPLQLCHLANLQELTSTLPYLFSIDLSSNALDGQIPEGLTRLARLQNLNLSQNMLVGKIPSYIGNLKDLESLDLSNNKLSGEIPPSISNLDFLSHLNLSYNNLSGPIPFGNQLSTLDDQLQIGLPNSRHMPHCNCYEADCSFLHVEDCYEASSNKEVVLIILQRFSLAFHLDIKNLLLLSYKIRHVCV
ncbi:hypothetical protein EUGRSUZ_I00372 [Eucalyptus grandis]|uniref:Uncharacterized protein n=2 Tax=Eucalyptus grandis TaxID=71139 RepID=A0ACC3JBK6_EUCGR|nr:hypothetical protein EUGRSUZ_I00372 [Eucalyptus grandis]